MQVYDSRKDYEDHVRIVRKNMDVITTELNNRAAHHDDSKKVSPEKEGYDEFIPKLKAAKYGSPEYEEIRKQMNDVCLSHHYEVNRHHPEHFENGIKDMTIPDLVEYFVDGYSASLKSDTPYADGVKRNAKVHNLPDVLVQIFINTVNEYFTK